MVKNSGFLGHFSRFWRFFNFYWILALQTAKIWFGMKILIFRDPWHPWGRVRSAWKENWLHLTQWQVHIGTVCIGKIWEFCLKYSKFWKNFLDISEWVSKKQLIFEEKSHLSKFKPNCANSCHNMGTIRKKISWQA